MPSFLTTTVAAATLAGTALAGFDAGSKSNVAVYWGQNSFGQGSGGKEQKSLATYCQDSNIDVRTSSSRKRCNEIDKV
jgi:chitinase